MTPDEVRSKRFRRRRFGAPGADLGEVEEYLHKVAALMEGLARSHGLEFTEAGLALDQDAVVECNPHEGLKRKGSLRRGEALSASDIDALVYESVVGAFTDDGPSLSNAAPSADAQKQATR